MWSVKDVQNRFVSRRHFTSFNAARQYLIILRARYPEYELHIFLDKSYNPS